MRRNLSFPHSPMKKSLLLALACALMPATMHADTTNLLTNPGAETGSISGWTVTFGAPGVDTFGPRHQPTHFAAIGADGAVVLARWRQDLGSELDL